MNRLFEASEEIEQGTRGCTVDKGSAELISVAECARRCNLNPSQIYRLIKREELPAFRFGKHLRIAWPACLDFLYIGPQKIVNKNPKANIEVERPNNFLQ